VRDKWELFCAGLDSARAFAADHRVFVEVLERDPQVLVGRRLVLFTNLRCPYRMRRDNDTTWCAHPGVQVGANGCGFSANLELGVFPGETVVFPCLELLCGWNFREIFVFGLDLSSGRRSYAEAGPAIRGVHRAVAPARRAGGPRPGDCDLELFPHLRAAGEHPAQARSGMGARGDRVRGPRVRSTPADGKLNPAALGFAVRPPPRGPRRNQAPMIFIKTRLRRRPSNSP